MGRYVRSILLHFAAQPDLTLTLLVRDMHDQRLYRDLIPGADIAPVRAARARTSFDAVWYPWNGMRFRSSAPSVVTINDDFAFAYPADGRIARWREQRPILRAAAVATRILTISAWTRTTLIERFTLDPQRISVIPLGPDRMFSPGEEASPYSEPFVLVVGTREQRKNTGFLIDAFVRAFPADDVRLVLVGELDAALLARTHAAKAITCCDGVDDTLLRRLYRTAAAVAVPSLAEGFGLVAAEAQACGAAVIAAQTSALPEVVGTAGILLDPRDAGAWSAALRELVCNGALNAYYRAQSAARWPLSSREGAPDAVRAALERAVDDRAQPSHKA